MPAKRPAGTVYLDYVQVGKGKTLVAPFSARARAGAPVSMPLDWTEVEAMSRKRASQTEGEFARFTIKNAPALVAERGDLWAGSHWKAQDSNRRSGWRNGLGGLLSMAHAIWSGAINFGLVTIPVKLFTAVRTNDLRFNFLHKKDDGRISNERHCTVCGEKVEYADLVRGYEYEKGHYVIAQRRRFQACQPRGDAVGRHRANSSTSSRSTRCIFDTPYYLEPEKKGRHAYALLRESLTRSEQGRHREGRDPLARTPRRAQAERRSAGARTDALRRRDWSNRATSISRSSRRSRAGRVEGREDADRFDEQRNVRSRRSSTTSIARQSWR